MNKQRLKRIIKEEMRKYLEEIPQTPTDKGRKMGQDPTGYETSTLGLEESAINEEVQIKPATEKQLMGVLQDVFYEASAKYDVKFDIGGKEGAQKAAEYTQAAAKKAIETIYNDAISFME